MFSTSPMKPKNGVSVSRFGELHEIRQYNISSVTTDVQSSTASVTSNSVTIQCNFISQTMSKGCHAKLSGTSPSITMLNIQRSNGSNSARRKIDVPEGIGRRAALMFTVFDWESDGSIGNVSIESVIEDLRGTTEGTVIGTANHGSVEMFLFISGMRGTSGNHGTIIHGSEGMHYRRLLYFFFPIGFRKWHWVVIVSSTGATVIATLLLIVLILSCVIFHKKSRSL